MSKAKHKNMTAPKKSLERKWRNPIEMLIELITYKKKLSKLEPKKDATDFVKRQRAIDKRAAVKIVLWDSSALGTYVRAKDGNLVNPYHINLKGDSK